MKWLHIIYDTIWFRTHPFIGPVAPDDPCPFIYPTWEEAYRLARLFSD
jgi:hypothetical protein